MMHIIQVLFLIVIVHEVKGNIINDFVQKIKRFASSSCACPATECCSKWGYCGTTDAYCGTGCRSGPCKMSYTSTFNITSKAFACVFPNLNRQLRTRRRKGLLAAMKQMKWKLVNSVEAAIFLAHVSHETDGLKTLSEYCSKRKACDNYQSSWCSIQARPNMKYYGRGWFQLSYPCNYYNAGKALGLDLLNNPDLVSHSDKIAASTAIWYFTETGMDKLAQQDDFGNTTRRLNEHECLGKAGYHMQEQRVKTYQRVRRCFNLSTATANLTC